MGQAPVVTRTSHDVPARSLSQLALLDRTLFCFRSCFLFQHANASVGPSVVMSEHLRLDKELSPAAAALIAFADPGLDSRITLIGSHVLDLLCALLRRGTISVSALRLLDWPQSGAADVVVAPYVASLAYLGRAVAQARRLLVPLGTLAMHLPQDPNGVLARQAGHLLLLHGFGLVRKQVIDGGTLVRAELPLYGRLACA